MSFHMWPVAQYINTKYKSPHVDTQYADICASYKQKLLKISHFPV